MFTNAGTINIYNTVFRNNSASAQTGGYYNNGATVENLIADFYNNSGGAGSAIQHWRGYIGNLQGTFDSNHGDIGAILAGIGTIDSISNSVFSNNIANAAGGAIYVGSTEGATINTIADTVFLNNSAQQGGAIYNVAGGTIGQIGSAGHNVLFKNNYAETSGTNAYGGAIANDTGKIGDIVADFDGNYAKSTGEFKAGGGVVISGDTGDNQGSGRAYGGAIFNLAQVTKDGDGNITGVVENTGVINSIQGEFKNNYVYR